MLNGWLIISPLLWWLFFKNFFFYGVIYLLRRPFIRHLLIGTRRSSSYAMLSFLSEAFQILPPPPPLPLPLLCVCECVLLLVSIKAGVFPAGFKCLFNDYGCFCEGWFFSSHCFWWLKASRPSASFVAAVFYLRELYGVFGWQLFFFFSCLLFLLLRSGSNLSAIDES